jgi:curli biogenesis system outer membrane secretion channel CsgG
MILGIGALGVAAPAALAAPHGGGDRPERIITDAIPPVPGPRRTIAVGNIDVIGPTANASATNVGGAIAGMLTTALEQSDRFIVVERDAMAQIVSELSMTKSGVTSGTAAPTPGGVLPAQYIVVGAVTDYTAPGAGRGGGFSFGGSTALTLGTSKGDVAIDLRIVDTRTGAVVKAFKVQRKLSSMNLGVSTSLKGVPIGSNGFFNTPLGEATRRALNDAVVQIALALAAQPWRGQVVKADGGQVWLNAGGEAGVVVGDRMSLQRVGETLTDPATGAVLSEQMVQLGEVTITSVQPKLSIGTYRAILEGAPARGDFVVQQN